MVGEKPAMCCEINAGRRRGVCDRYTDFQYSMAEMYTMLRLSRARSAEGAGRRPLRRLGGETSRKR